MFSVHTTPEESKRQQSPVILDLCLEKKPLSGKSHDYLMVIVFKTFSLYSKTKTRRFGFPGRKSVFENGSVSFYSEG